MKKKQVSVLKGWMSVAKRPFKQKFGSLLCLSILRSLRAALALDPQRAAARLGCGVGGKEEEEAAAARRRKVGPVTPAQKRSQHHLNSHKSSCVFI